MADAIGYRTELRLVTYTWRGMRPLFMLEQQSRLGQWYSVQSAGTAGDLELFARGHYRAYTLTYEVRAQPA